MKPTEPLKINRGIEQTAWMVDTNLIGLAARTTRAEPGQKHIRLHYAGSAMNERAERRTPENENVSNESTHSMGGRGNGLHWISRIQRNGWVRINFYRHLNSDFLITALDRDNFNEHCVNSHSVHLLLLCGSLNSHIRAKYSLAILQYEEYVENQQRLAHMSHFSRRFGVFYGY